MRLRMGQIVDLLCKYLPMNPIVQKKFYQIKIEVKFFRTMDSAPAIINLIIECWFCL